MCSAWLFQVSSTADNIVLAVRGPYCFKTSWCFHHRSCTNNCSIAYYEETFTSSGPLYFTPRCVFWYLSLVFLLLSDLRGLAPFTFRQRFRWKREIRMSGLSEKVCGSLEPPLLVLRDPLPYVSRTLLGPVIEKRDAQERTSGAEYIEDDARVGGAALSAVIGEGRHVECHGNHKSHQPDERDWLLLWQAPLKRTEVTLSRLS